MSRNAVARKINRRERIKREKDPIPWRYCLTTLACGLFLVVGFFGAARQHFSSIDYGIKNSNLRKQLENLQAENRRLLLSKEVALSPAEIKKSAKQFGMVELSASNIEIFSTREEKNTPKEKTVKSLVEKTADIKPVKNASDDKTLKTDSSKEAKLAKDGKPLKNTEAKSGAAPQKVK